MAISYPLSLPTHAGITGVEFHTTNAVAYSRSPFTYSGQAHAYAGQMLQVDVSLPPMRRNDAEKWIAWLISLRGQLGTFYLGDPMAITPIGSARDVDSIAVNGALSSGSEISIDGAPANQSKYLSAGDYLQIGSGVSMQLFKVLSDVATNASGAAVVDVWPNVRTSIPNNASVAVEATQGLWRQSNNQQSWSISGAQIYGLSFSAMEAI